jgi:hypothetical protein
MRISDSTLRRFWKNYRPGGRATKGIDPMVAEHLWDLLSALSAAARPEDMKQPGWAFTPSPAIARDSTLSRFEPNSAWCSNGRMASQFA